VVSSVSTSVSTSVGSSIRSSVRPTARPTTSSVSVIVSWGRDNGHIEEVTGFKLELFDSPVLGGGWCLGVGVAFANMVHAKHASLVGVDNGEGELGFWVLGIHVDFFEKVSELTKSGILPCVNANFLKLLVFELLFQVVKLFDSMVFTKSHENPNQRRTDFFAVNGGWCGRGWLCC